MMQSRLRATALAGLVAALMVGLAPAAPAESKTLKRTYSDLYHVVKNEHGKRAPGRNIRRYGVQTKKGTRDATNRELARSIRTFRRWLAPPVAFAAPGDTTPTAYTAAASHTGGKWAIPTYIVMCESRGDYGALNPSGAGGAYQIMPGTWRAYGGTGSPHTAPPAEQDRIAAKIYAAEGASPWVCG